MSNTPPVPTGLVKPKPISLIHSPPLHPHRPEPNTYTCHTLHQHLSQARCLYQTKHLNHVYHSYMHSPQPHLTRIPRQHCRHPRTLTALTHATQTTVHASQSLQQPHAQHRVLRQPHKQTKDYHRTTNTTQTHRPSSKSERNLIILQVNINGLRNKLEELKLLIHDTHADIITIQETKLTPKAKTPKIHNFTSVRTNRLHKAGGGCCCCLPTPMTLASGGSPMFPLVVHQPASPSIWPAVQSLRRGLSTNPGVTMQCVCGCS